MNLSKNVVLVVSTKIDIPVQYKIAQSFFDVLRRALTKLYLSYRLAMISLNSSKTLSINKQIALMIWKKSIISQHLLVSYRCFYHHCRTFVRPN